jgi:[ribosomal protein S18]-alanine N-acetyltransferase
MVVIIETFNHTAGGAADYARLRLVALEDLRPLEILEKEVFHDLAYSMDLLRTFYNLYRTTWHVADHDGDLAGYALVGLSADSSDGWLLGLAVSSRYRRQGLGGKLMRRAMDSMMAYNVSDAYLTVRPDNDAAHRMYDEHGFVLHGEAVPDYYGNGEPREVLHRSLRSNPYLFDS